LLGLDLEGGAFDDFEKSLLNAFATNVFAMACFCGADLVDFVEADDATFCGCDIVVRGCEESLDADLGVFAYVTGLGEGGTIGHAERDGENAGKGFGHQSLADT